MPIEVKVPVLPESVEDATIATWYKKAGDVVRRDENLVDLETDKVVLEVPAPADGVLNSILAEAGQTVSGGELLALIDEAPVTTPGRSAAPMTATPQVQHTGVQHPGVQPVAVPGPAIPGSVNSTATPAAPAEMAKLSPAVRRVVAEEHIDPGMVAGSGRGGPRRTTRT